MTSKKMAEFVKNSMVLILVPFGFALLAVSACNDLDGMQALAGVACWAASTRCI